jgi:hypothetical protein
MKQRKTKTLVGISAVVLSPLLLYAFFIWSAWDYSPYAFQADSCLDHGGCWDEMDNVCRDKEPNAQQLCDRAKAK